MMNKFMNTKEKKLERLLLQQNIEKTTKKSKAKCSRYLQFVSKMIAKGHTKGWVSFYKVKLKNQKKVAKSEFMIE